ncbi:hypothetical protein D6853_14340 [Butyrivibrio sp. X503]|uniref:transglutaminase domain-containing protein n=1 Tax=Butyrivibrio sp. X503 TaxID=2364878 RepID=UPI000EAA8EE9|nr:transglutaminase domain-containing protein [Butyrivibrio sp. X503]RKM54113.1 hypothetical protein D6853_14340 [Butyrivibrio sp. X503]
MRRLKLLISSGILCLLLMSCSFKPIKQIDACTELGRPVYSGEKFAFNPHVCPKKLYEAYGPEEWETFFKLCDALRAGEDTFECPSREVYDWCFSGGPLDEFFPVARYSLESDCENGYADGIGYIKYAIPKDEFLRKQKEFEKMVTDILNENVSKDYTDFEKCVALYEYMINNYVYDYRESANNTFEKMANLPRGTYGTYRTFKDKKGMCGDLSNVYNYLLLQCGVDAVQYIGGPVEKKHAWSYVTIDGAGYFIDPTWGLPDKSPNDLTYFMITAVDRESDFGDTMEPVEFGYDHRNIDVDFSADDNRYASLHEGDFVSLDREKKTLYYKVGNEKREYHYSS